jgi:hypothetical protein
MKLRHEIIGVSGITDIQRLEMYRLMEIHYGNVNWNDFNSDLNEKNWVILLYSCDSSVMTGFSTQMIFTSGDKKAFNDKIVLFSGDTIIAHEYWGSIELPIAFVHLVTRIQNEFPGKKIFWMLISKSLRTYKFLSVFTIHYYPNHFSSTPADIEELMFMVGAGKFGNRYNRIKGIIEAGEDSQFLKEVFQPRVKENDTVATYFYARNPGYCKGDELLCMTELSDDNYQPYLKRILKQHAQ